MENALRILRLASRAILCLEPAPTFVFTVDQSTGIVQVSCHYVFIWETICWGHVKIYLGIPEDTILLEGSENAIKNFLENGPLNVPTTAFREVLAGQR